ncbi:MAG: hypothetical protein ACR2L1_05120 [Pyrinomonadaceae bacterium]
MGSREDISSEVKKINVPVLVAAGERDKAMTGQLLRQVLCRAKRQ